jgi:hypothetical protein
MSASRDNMKKAQLTIEFIIFCGIAFLVMISFASVISEKMSNLRNEKEHLLVKDMAFSIQQEIETASLVNDGYERNLTLPETLDGISYTVNLTSNMVIVATQKNSYEVFVKPVKNGSSLSFFNTIRKYNGTICINTACP